MKAKVIKYLQSFTYTACVYSCINTYLSSHVKSHNPAQDFIFLTISFFTQLIL